MFSDSMNGHLIVDNRLLERHRYRFFVRDFSDIFRIKLIAILFGKFFKFIVIVESLSDSTGHNHKHSYACTHWNTYDSIHLAIVFFITLVFH